MIFKRFGRDMYTTTIGGKEFARMLSGGMCLTNAPSSNNATNATPMMKIRLKFRKLDFIINAP